MLKKRLMYSRKNYTFNKLLFSSCNRRASDFTDSPFCADHVLLPLEFGLKSFELFRSEDSSHALRLGSLSAPVAGFARIAARHRQVTWLPLRFVCK